VIRRVAPHGTISIYNADRARFIYHYNSTYELLELNGKYRAKFRASLETVFGQDRIIADIDRWLKENNYPTIGYKIKKINTRKIRIYALKDLILLLKQVKSYSLMVKILLR